MCAIIDGAQRLPEKRGTGLILCCHVKYTDGSGGGEVKAKKKLVMTLNLHMSDILSVRRQYIF